MKEMIKWNPIFIGLLIAIIPIIMAFVSGGTNYSVSFLLAGLVVGYLAGRDMKDGLYNGIILGLVAGAIFIILQFSLTLYSVYYEYAAYGMGTMFWQALPSILPLLTVSLLSQLIIPTIMVIIIAIIGGLVGSVIRDVLLGKGDIKSLDVFESYEYNLPTALGYVLGLLGGIIGIIPAIYLFTRDDKLAKTHGAIIIGICALWILIIIQITISMA